MTIKNIILDIDGVVLDVSFPSVNKAVGETLGIDGEQFHEFLTRDLNAKLLNHITGEQLAQEAKEQFGITEDIISIWVEEYLKQMKLREGVVEFMQHNKDIYTFIALTNVTEFRDIADIQIDLYKDFHYAYRSCAVGKKKPNHDFYEHALGDAGIEAAESVYLDDQEKNIIPARELGMHGIVVESEMQMFASLEKLGITK